MNKNVNQRERRNSTCNTIPHLQSRVHIRRASERSRNDDLLLLLEGVDDGLVDAKEVGDDVLGDSYE